MKELKIFTALALLIPAVMLVLFHGMEPITTSWQWVKCMAAAIILPFTGSGLMFGFKGYKEKISAFSLTHPKVEINNTWLAFIVSSMLHISIIPIISTTNF